MSMQKSMCPFCEEQKNRGISIINKSRILAETDNFVVFPTTGGFVENYQLIVPKNHINCFGELSKEQLVELKSIILWQQEINRNILTQIVLCLNMGHYILAMRVEKV